MRYIVDSVRAWLGSSTMRRVGRATNELVADGILTIVFMLMIFCVGKVATFLGIDHKEILYGFSLSTIFLIAHGFTAVVMLAVALWHLVHALIGGDHD